MTKPQDQTTTDPNAPADAPSPAPEAPANRRVPEIGGRGGPDPTRYGDWEQNGRCVDF